MDTYGRRFGCMISALPLVVGWTMIASANRHALLLGGRLLAGFGVGLAAPSAQILLAECAEPELRGFLGALPIVAYSLGILITYTLGALMSWRAVAWCCTIVPVLSLGASLLAPDSPTWLARKGKLDRALAALLWLRCDELNARRELATISGRFERERLEAAALNSGNEDSFWRLVMRTDILKPVTIISVFNVLGLLAGTYLVVFYVIDIIRDIDMDGMDAMHAAILTALVRLVASVMCSVLVYTMNRRAMLIGASWLAGFSCLALVVFRWCRAGVFAKEPVDTYVPVICLLVYIGSSMAFMMFPGIMVSELLPARVRGQVSGVIFCVMHVIFFGTAKAFPYFAQLAKMDGVFVLFGVSSLLTAMFIWALMPETRGRTLEQIEDYFISGKWLWLRRPADSDAKVIDDKCV